MILKTGLLSVLSIAVMWPALARAEYTCGQIAGTSEGAEHGVINLVFVSNEEGSQRYAAYYDDVLTAVENASSRDRQCIQIIGSTSIMTNGEQADYAQAGATKVVEKICSEGFSLLLPRCR